MRKKNSACINLNAVIVCNVSKIEETVDALFGVLSLYEVMFFFRHISTILQVIAVGLPIVGIFFY